MWPSLFRQRFVVNAQASWLVVNDQRYRLWKGEFWPVFTLKCSKKRTFDRACSVLRLIEHSEMASAVENIARRLKLSGLHGLDFMLEAHTGNAHLIEINPRTTQVGQLALGLERDLQSLCMQP